MKVSSSLLLLFLIVFCNGFSQSKNSVELKGIPLRNHFESSDYNGGIQNWSIDQDSLGIIYVANNDGLLEFDGYKWSKHKVPDCNKVRAVKVDTKNTIFVGGQGQIGYFVMTNYGLQFKSLMDLLPETYQTVSEVWKIIELDDKIYFNTESQILVYDYHSLKILNSPGYIHRLFKLNNKLFAQFSLIGIYEFNNDKFRLIEGTSSLPEIIAMETNNNSVFYFSRMGSIFIQSQSDIQELVLPFTLGSINQVLRLSSGDLAISTQNNGIFILSKELKLKQNFTKNKGITDRTVKLAYEDNFGNLWLALNNGLDYLKTSLPFSMLNEEVGIEGSGYVAAAFKGEYYLGTNNGLFKFQKSNTSFGQTSFELIKGSEGQVYNLSIVNEELFINHHRGAFYYKAGRLRLVNDIGNWKFMNSPVKGVILGGDYIGISFYSKKNGEWFKEGSIPNFNESSRVLEYENDTTLWMTHGNKGAYRFLFYPNTNDLKEMAYFGAKDGFPSNLKISVYRINNQLIFTSERGVFSFNPIHKKFEEVAFFNDRLGSKHINEMVNDANGVIYFIQDLKMGRLYQKAFGDYQLESSIFRHINKYINDDLSNISILGDHILIGAKEGFVLYNPDFHKERSNPLQVALRSVEITSSNDSIIAFYPDAINNSKLAQNNSIKFLFSSAYFDGYEELTYSYRLLPLNKNWSVWNKSGEKEYPFLSSGKYIFEVKSRNIYGDESEVSRFSFTILAPWYFTGLAIFSYITLGIFLIGLVLVIQNKKHKVEKHIITEDKEKTIQSKNEEINTISEASRKEISKLHNEKLKTELNLKNDQLTTITMQLMQNNEYILDIKNKIQESIGKSSENGELERIISTIDRRLEDNDSWDQFAYHFDQVHGGYLKKLSSKNIKLSPREIKLASFLRMNMSSKEISKLMNVTVRSVELARYRLRKKLKIDHDQNLVEYLIDLDNE